MSKDRSVLGIRSKIKKVQQDYAKTQPKAYARDLKTVRKLKPKRKI